MRALLVNPWIYDFAAYDLWSKPLGILNIASCLERLGCEVSLVDCLDRFHPALKIFFRRPFTKNTPFGNGPYYSKEVKKPEIFKDIPRKFKRYGMPKEVFNILLDAEPDPDIILITSGMTYWYPGVFEAVKIVKQKFPDIPVILGGIYVNLCFEHAKANSGADFVYKGNSVGEVLRLISQVAGVRLDYSLIDYEHIMPSYGLYHELRYVTLRTSGGCPFRCSYCGWYLLEKTFSQQDPDFVIGEIEYFYKKYKIKNFAFYDEALLHNAERHIIIIFKELIKRKIKANFHTPNGLHARFVTEETAGLFKKSGFVQPRLALETTSAKRQIESGEKTSTRDFLKALTLLEDAGYKSNEIGVNILIGLPGQSFEEMEESIRFAGSKKARIFLEEYSPIPGTPDYLKSGLPMDADPLLHNNSVFPLYRPEEHRIFQQLKTLTHGFRRGDL